VVIKMNYTSYFRFLILAPMAMVFLAVALDFSYAFPESINGFWGQKQWRAIVASIMPISSWL